MLHTDNQPIHSVSESDLRRKYIRMMWNHRKDERVQYCIRLHIHRIRHGNHGTAEEVCGKFPASGIRPVAN